MKLLIITQKIDKQDPILGFFVRWVEEFAKHRAKLTVICLQKGLPGGISANSESEAIPLGAEYDFPKNVKVLSLGKEDFKDSELYGLYRLFQKFKYTLNFWKHIREEKDNYDVVFVHMNPIYVILGAIPWKTWGKKITLWYVHRSVDLKLRIAEFVVDKIFTASKESFTLPSNKVNVMGHGIPIEDFKKPTDYKRKDDIFRIISVGRVTPIKNLDTLIEAVSLIKKDIPNFEVYIVGGPTQVEDEDYFNKLKKLVHNHKLEKQVIFVGSVPNDKVKEYYWKSDLSVNLCPTGGVDKAVLESIASGLPVLVSNASFADYFGDYKKKLMFIERNPRDLADKILAIHKGKEKGKIIAYLMKEVENRASLKNLIKNIIESF